jgi:hypothetical protein
MEFIKGNWKSTAVVIAILLVAVYVEYLRMDNAFHEAQIVRLQTDNTTLKTNNANLEASIASANAALIETDKAATKANNNMVALGGKITQQTADLKQHMDKILADKAPATCGDTITYLVNAAGGYPK